MKKLLHIGCNVGTESMPKYFREQCDYTEIPLNDNTANAIDQLDFVPDNVFIQIQNDKIGNKNTCDFIGPQIRALRDSGSIIENWTGDLRNDLPRWMIDFSNNVTVTSFSNNRDVDKARKYGIRTRFLQCGIDTNIFTDIGDKADCPEIIFLANNYGNQFPLSRYRRDAVEALQREFGSRFGVYGNGWKNPKGNLNHSQYEEAKYYRNCKIAINISHYDSDRYFSDRLGRALSCGAFVLSHHYSGIEKDFQVGEHLESFESIGDLVNKCKIFIDRDNREIAKKGQSLARKEFSYQNIAKQILELK